MGPWGTAVSGMNCPKCGAMFPAEAAYCPSCGTPRSEIDHLMRHAERAVSRALVVGTTVLDRAAKELQPTFSRAVETLRPAVEAVGKATNDVVVAVTPPAEGPLPAGKEVAGKTLAGVETPGTKATQKNGQTGPQKREKGRNREGNPGR